MLATSVRIYKFTVNIQHKKKKQTKLYKGMVIERLQFWISADTEYNTT